MARTGNVLLALVTGVAIGVGAGILFAPDKGKNTRKKIKDSVDDTAQKLKQKLETLTEEVKHKTDEVRGLIRLFQK